MITAPIAADRLNERGVLLDERVREGVVAFERADLRAHLPTPGAVEPSA